MRFEFDPLQLSRQERRLLRRLIAAGAVSSASAHPLPALPSAPSGWRARLEAQGLVHPAYGDRFYVDADVYHQFLGRRRVRQMVGGLVVAALVIGVMLLWR